MSIALGATAVDRKHATSPLDAACLAVLAIAHAPYLFDYFARLWTTPHYDFFPLAAAGAVYLGYRERGRLRPPADEAPRRAVPAFVAGALLLAAVVLLDSPWLALVSFVWHLGAVAWRIGGPDACRAMIPAGLMCLTFLRLPLGIDARLVQSLQTITARMSSAALDFLGVLHVRAGNVIEIPGRRLLVEEACSGVNSLFAAGACTLFYVLWRRLGTVRAVLLMLTVPFWTVVANAARVVLTAELRYRWDIAADEGSLHDALGLAVFAVAMLFIFSTAAGFEFLRLLFGGAPRDDDAPAEDETAESSGPRGATEDGRETAPSAGAPRPVPLWVAALALAICALQAPGLAARVGDHRVRQKLVGLAEMGEGAMPDTVGEYRRTRFERIDRGVGAELGEISQSWHYDGPETRSVASLDYAFFGWHEITDCYLAQGWQVDSRELTTMSDGPTIVEVTMHRPERAEFAHLAFLVCDPAGEPLPAAQSRKISMTEELSERTRMVVNSIRGVSRPEHRPTAQFQLFSQGFAPPDETRRATLRELYVRLWRDARTHLARAAEVSP